MKEKSGIFCPVRKNLIKNCTGQKNLWDMFECLVATKIKALEMIAKKVQCKMRKSLRPEPNFILIGF